MVPKRVLAVRTDRFGEFLLAIPALRALKGYGGGAEVTLAVHPSVRELAACIEYADSLLEWEEARHTLRELLQEAGRLRKERFDACVIFNPSKEFNIVAALAGIPQRVGWDHKWHFLLTRTCRDDKYRGLRHEIDSNLALAGLLGVPEQGRHLSLRIPAGAAGGLLDGRASGRIVAVHPFTSDSLKQWPEERFQRLSQLLRKESGVTVVIIGKSGTPIADDRYPGCLSLVNKTTLLQLAGVLQQSTLLISGDSGPVHLASCTGTKTIALFRDDMPGKGWRRWGPAGESSVVIAREHLTGITVEDVYEKAKELL